MAVVTGPPRAPADDIPADASGGLVAVRYLLTALAFVLYAVGFATRKVVIEAPIWIVTAVRVGWEDARK